jgi:glycosyltransferase involved in cell wall biosynthesis
MFISEVFRVKNNVNLLELTQVERDGALASLDMSSDSLKMSKFYVAALNFKSRLARPTFYPRFKISKLDADIFVQQQVDPLKVNSKIAHVLRLHDILPLTHPHYFDNLSVQVFSKSFRKMIKKKPYIVMDSQSSADELISMFDLQGKVFVVPPVIDCPSEPISIKKKQIIIVNTLEPRKRTQSAIDGFLYAKLSGFINEEWKLIVVGGKGWLQEKLFDNLNNKKFEDLVEYFDSPSDATLAQLYDDSAIVLSLSAAEGFGLPPLEGMYYGCLPVVSEIKTHRENLADNAIYVKDVDPVSVALALRDGVEAISRNGKALEEQMKKYVRANFNKNIISLKWKSTLEKIHQLHQNKS